MRKMSEQNLPALSFESLTDFLFKQRTEVVDGNADGYKLAVRIKQLEYVLKFLKDGILETVIEEIDKENGRAVFEDYAIEKSKGGRYDYSGNEEWKELNEKIKKLEADMQKASKLDGKYINEDGEIIPEAVFKPYKTSYRITKAK